MKNWPPCCGLWLPWASVFCTRTAGRAVLAGAGFGQLLVDAGALPGHRDGDLAERARADRALARLATRRPRHGSDRCRRCRAASARGPCRRSGSRRLRAPPDPRASGRRRRAAGARPPGACRCRGGTGQAGQQYRAGERRPRTAATEQGHWPHDTAPPRPLASPAVRAAPAGLPAARRGASLRARTVRGTARPVGRPVDAGMDTAREHVRCWAARPRRPGPAAGSAARRRRRVRSSAPSPAISSPAACPDRSCSTNTCRCASRSTPPRTSPTTSR